VASDQTVVLHRPHSDGRPNRDRPCSYGVSIRTVQ
jgi:hypothetical protein